MDCVKTNVDQEAGSLGAAAVAAVGAGLWKELRAGGRGPPGRRACRSLVPRRVEAYRRLMPVFERMLQDEAASCQMLLDSGC